jgi:hypothetical protein
MPTVQSSEELERSGQYRRQTQLVGMTCLLKRICEYMRSDPQGSRDLLPFLALVTVGRPEAKLVSSNGRHLKSFLYPPHWTFRLSH